MVRAGEMRTSEAIMMGGVDKEMEQLSDGTAFMPAAKLASDDRLAYSLATVAELVDLSYCTVWRAVKAGLLRRTVHGLITRVEVLRWLDSGMPRPRSKRNNQVV